MKKVQYYTNYHVKTGKCIGVLKIEKSGESEEGYYRRNGVWVRDDDSVLDGAYGQNMDWFEASEDEAMRAIKEVDEDD